MSGHEGLSELPAGVAERFGALRAHRVHGGDIARSYRLDTRDGPIFLKTHPSPAPRMFEREARGLRALREAAPPQLGVPAIVGESPAWLALEWIEEGRGHGHRESESELGRGLAAVHAVPRAHFGGLNGDDSGYIGSVPVDLTPTPSWPEFYAERRIRPLARRAEREGKLPAEALRLLDALEPRAAELCGPPEPPALVHGDLWAGNRLVDAAGRNWLIDPAAHHAHREVDLAMMRLFGGFGPRAFATYHEALPLADGWRERVPWYQLAPLLVHAILFGGSYGRSAFETLHRLTHYPSRT